MERNYSKYSGNIISKITNNSKIDAEVFLIQLNLLLISLSFLLFLTFIYFETEKV